MLNFYCRTIAFLNTIGSWLPQLVLRLLLAYEFGEAGLMKLRGDNWFAHVQDNFPFPFNVIPVDVSWFMATWAELIMPVLLIFGLATRFASTTLIILTIVAIAAVHWPTEITSFTSFWSQGYDISNSDGGNFKLPLLFLSMLFVLLFSGAGKLSLDAAFNARFCTQRDGF